MRLSIIITSLACCFLLLSCKKYLDEKPDIKLSVPTTLLDYQKLLNANEIVTGTTPGVPDLCCDDYYLDYDAYQALSNPTARNCYTWESTIYPSEDANDWSNPYRFIYLSNVVLEGLEKLPVANPAEQELWNTIYGHALFLRGTFHYFLAETFGQPYKPSSAKSNLGIPLKLTSSLEDAAIRSTVQSVFDQIIKDLSKAKDMLPPVSATKNWSSKAAAFAMLARVYLTMQDYSKAGAMADSSLSYYDTLYDFNLIPSPATNNNPFSAVSPPNDNMFETLFYFTQISYGVLRLSTTSIDTSLYNSFDDNDLRKQVFFRQNTSKNTWYFKGYYSGSALRPFSGPAVDEMYLIRAECYARNGNVNAALLDLNRLLRKRWKSSLFVDLTATDEEDALKMILVERRKELIFRGLRWSDLRRLNQDSRFAFTLTRELNGSTITLLPGDVKYTFPIPLKEIALSGMQQNPR